MILMDSKVLSVLPLKKRGEKGWRDLQGDTLRELLLELIRKEVSSEFLCTVTVVFDVPTAILCGRRDGVMVSALVSG